MKRNIRYGADAVIQLEIPLQTDVLVDHEKTPPLKDAAAATEAALREPVAFPALVEATVPGDHVTIVLDEDIVEPAPIVAGIVRSLTGGRSAPGDLVVLQTQASAGCDPLAQVPEEMREEIRVFTHDPAVPEEMALLSTFESGEPIVFNRLLIESDMVLPVVSTRPQESADWNGAHGGLFPAFSDKESRTSRLGSGWTEAADRRRIRLEEVEQAFAQLGVFFTLFATPGPGGTTQCITAGETGAALHSADDKHRRTWEIPVARRPSLVIASLTGGPAHQSWTAFARALDAASRIVATDGMIVVCSEISTPPGTALRRLRSPGDIDEIFRKIRREKTPDSLAALRLGQLLEQNDVCLLSQLDEETVEDIGMGYIAGGEDIQRLAARFDSVLVLNDAPHAVPVDLTEKG